MNVNDLISELSKMKSILNCGEWEVGYLDTEYFVYVPFQSVEIRDGNRVYLESEE